MDIFFNDGKNIVKSDAMDLNIGSDSDEFYIGVIFKDFPKDFIVDTTVATTLEDEYLLNKDGFLEIKKVYKKGKNTDTYLVANYPTSSILETIHLDTNKELKEKVNKYKLIVEDKRKSSLLRKALIKEFDTLELKSKELTIDKEGTKQIWKSIERYFPLFELFQSDRKNLDQDNEIQNPMKLLIKEIIKKEMIDEKLNEIFNEIKVKTEELTELTVKKLSEMNPEISKSLETNFSAP
nr:AAA family ATPase [Staphylococcus xylosus]